MDNRAIGVFDSGLGGLTTVRELRKLLPDERIVYFGDTGRVPYGNRSRETIRKYAMQDIRFLKRHEVKLVIAACGTVSSALTPELSAEAGVPCEVSMEKRMACGVGACLSCVVDTVGGKQRACVDGPVFDARKVVW